MAQPSKPAKTMSSRLSTMKFMQRGAAAASLSSPKTPSEPPSKKQRLSSGSYLSTPSSTPRSDSRVVEEVVTTEERKNSEAVEREGARRGETKWYLSFKEPQQSTQETPLHIVSAGFSMLDATALKDRSSEEEEGQEAALQQFKGRRSFGKFNRAVEKQQDPDASASGSDSDSESSEEDEDESDDPTGAKAMIAQTRKEAGEKARAERTAKRKADTAEAARMAEERRNKQVKLNRLKSISGGGVPPSRSSGHKDMTCFKCGKKGHGQRDCPQSPQQRQRMH